MNCTHVCFHTCGVIQTTVGDDVPKNFKSETWFQKGPVSETGISGVNKQMGRNKIVTV